MIAPMKAAALAAPVELRAITVRQPWAWAIAHAGKDVENRTRNLAGTYRGPLAIHAGLTAATDAQAWWPLSDLVPLGALRNRGVFVAVVDLVDVHPVGAEPRDGWCSTWALGTGHHLVLANPRPLAEPVPARGRLGLWTPTPTQAAAIAAQLGEDPTA
ncbi:hypothetical protein SAMN04487781_3200 [Cellulosimicrobium cellulans]|nr:hypothetical protein SAMN04487781_3200 [Cellulosimicrobium cellulans]